MEQDKQIIKYGDYIYVAFRQKGEEWPQVLTANGFFSEEVWAGPVQNLNMRSFRNCLFQIFPTQHSAKDIFVKEFEDQVNLLKGSNNQNELIDRILGPELKEELEKEQERQPNIDKLNEKEKSETFGNPLQFGAKFMLKHVESGMFLQSSSKHHPRGTSADFFEVSLVKVLNHDCFFELGSPLPDNPKGDDAYYKDFLHVYSPTMNNYLTYSSPKDIQAEIEIKDNPLLKNPEFVEFPPRRPKPNVDNHAFNIAGAAMSPKTIVNFVNYCHSNTDLLRTGGYLRFANQTSYFTIYQHQEESKSELFFQKFKTPEYRYNHIKTVFQIIKVPEDSHSFQTQETIETIPTSKIKESRDSAASMSSVDKNFYMLRHVVSGKYVALVDENIDKSPSNVQTYELKYQLVSLRNAGSIPPGVYPLVQFVADPYEGNQNLHNTQSFWLRFKTEDSFVYMNLEDETKNTFAKNQTKAAGLARMGKVKEEESNHFFKDGGRFTEKTKPIRQHIRYGEKPDGVRGTFKCVLFSDDEINYIRETESLMNQFDSFFDFCWDFRLPTQRTQDKVEDKASVLTAARTNRSDKKGSASHKELIEAGILNRFSKNKKSRKPSFTRKSVGDVPGKIEKECIIVFTEQINKLQKTIVQYLEIEDQNAFTRKAPREGDEKDPDYHKIDQGISTIDNVKQWIARQFRIVDYINLLIYLFLSSDVITDMILEVQKYFPPDTHDTDFHIDNLNILFSALIKLLLEISSSDDLNRLYNTQYAYIYIRALTKLDSGFYTVTPIEELSHVRKLLLDCCKAFMWDEGYDSIEQLNDYADELQKTIETRQSFDPYLLKLLEIQALSKVPNLRDFALKTFSRKLLNDEKFRSHVFPTLSVKNEVLLVNFWKYSKAGLTLHQQYAFSELEANPRVTSEEAKTKDPERGRLAFYLCDTFEFIANLSNLGDPSFLLTIIKHYPSTLLLMTKHKHDDGRGSNKIQMKLRSTIEKIIQTAHIGYLSGPIDSFPIYIILNAEELTRKLYQETYKKIIENNLNRVEDLLSDVELEAVKERGIQTEIQNCLKLAQEYRNNKTLESSRRGLNNFALLYRKSFEKILENPSIDRSQIQTVLNNFEKLFNILRDFISNETIVELRSHLISESKDSLSSLVPKDGENDLLLVSARSQFTQSEYISPLASGAGIKKITEILERVMSSRLQEWRSGKMLTYLEETKGGIEEKELNFSTSNVIKALFEIMPSGLPADTYDIFQKLNKMKSLDKYLFHELEKLVLLNETTEMDKVQKLLPAIFQLNKFKRTFWYLKESGLTLPPEKLQSTFEEINKIFDLLLFTILNPTLAFFYTAEESGVGEQELLEGIQKLKSPTMELPFRLNPRAINKHYQPMYLLLQVPQLLLHFLEFEKQIRENLETAEKVPDKFLNFANIVRCKVLIILQAMIYKNEKNQFSLSKMRLANAGLSSEAYDFMLLFAEMMRDNKGLLKLEETFLLRQTADTFLKTLETPLDSKLSDASLPTALASLHFIGKVPQEDIDCTNIFANKFAQMIDLLCEDSNSLDLVSLWQNTKEENEDVIQLPYCYYGSRELLASWLEVPESFLSQGSRLNHIFGKIPFKKWLVLLRTPTLLFQFELRQLICKTLAYAWYGTETRLRTFDTYDEFLDLVFTLFADVTAYIQFRASEANNSELDNYKLEIEEGCLFSRDSALNQIANQMMLFRNEGLAKSKVRIYFEDVNLMDLWEGYILDGCLPLLTTFLDNEISHMLYHIGEKGDLYPDLASYLFFLIEKLTFIPIRVSQHSFEQVTSALGKKISLLPEYEKYKQRINMLTKLTRVTKRKIPTFVLPLVSKKSNRSIHEIYHEELRRLAKKSIRQAKLRNIREMSSIISTSKQERSIVRKIIELLNNQNLNPRVNETSFMMNILRKIIERDGDSGENHLKEVFEWEHVSSFDLKRLQKTQQMFQELNFTTVFISLVFDARTEKEMTSTLKLGLAYVYGGKKEIQDEFYELFSKDVENRFLITFRKMIDRHTGILKDIEPKRLRSAYTTAVRSRYKQLSEETDKTYTEQEIYTRVRQNFPMKYAASSTVYHSNQVLVLILSFIQGLIDNQSQNIQAFLREQNYIDRRGVLRKLPESYNFLSGFRSLFNTYYHIYNSNNLNLGNKLLSVLIELVEGAVAENIIDLLQKNLLHDMCRLLNDYNNSFHRIPRGFNPTMSQQELNIRSRTIVFLKVLAEQPNPEVRAKLEKYLDFDGLLNSFESIMLSFFEIDVTKNLDKKSESSVRSLIEKKVQDRTLEMKDFDGPLLDGFNIYMILRYIWDDFIEYRKNVLGFINHPKRTKNRRQILSEILLNYMVECVRGVEVLLQETVDNQVVKYWFPKLLVCNYLLPASRDKFIDTVDRSNSQSKTTGLLESIEAFTSEMYLSYESRLGLGTVKKYALLRVTCNLVCIAINAINLLFLRYEDDTVIYENSNAEIALHILCLVNLVLASLILVSWLLVFAKSIIKTDWDRYSSEFRKNQGPLSPSIEEKIEEDDYASLTPEEVIELVKYKGTNSEEYKRITADPTLNKQVLWFKFKMGCKFLFSTRILLWHIVFVLICVAALWSPVAAAILLVDIAVQSDAITPLIKAILANWKQFLWTFYLLVMMAIVYTLIGFYFLQGAYQDDEGNALCDNITGCFLMVLNEGLRNGGGIGDVIQTPLYSETTTWYYIGLIIYQLLFFITMITILLNLIFGMIIDAFGDLRDQRTANEEDEKNICFICGIPRGEFERYTSFEDHIDNEHDLWNYVYLIVYLEHKYKHKPTEMTKLENYVLEKYNRKVNDWLPIQRSIRLERLKIDYGNEDDTAEIKKSIAVMAQDIKSLAAEVKAIGRDMTKPVNLAQQYTRIDALRSQTILQMQADSSN